MSQAEELLNGLSEEVPVHSHPVPDSDTYFTIDPITRKIENTNRKKAVVMQYDHNSERFTFELPRYVDGHDMLECTSITVNVDNIGVEVDDVNSDAPDMTDLRINPKNPDTVISSWLISRNLTQLVGILSFSIEYKCADAAGNVVYEWSTDIFNEVEVKARKKNGEAAIIEHTDLLEQWRTQIFGAGDSVMANIAAKGEEQVAAIKTESETQQDAVELKGAQTLDSIPEDYTEVDAMAEEAVRNKGDAIVCETAGKSIVLKDSSNNHIRGLKLFGKSTQRTTSGKNLLDVDENLSFTGLREKTVNIPAGTYVLTWAGRTTAGQNKPVIRFVDNSILIDLLADVGNSKVTLAKDETTIYIYSNGYDYTASENVSATITQFMLSVDGGTYEPYTGGKPAPNPEYPQEIVSVENPSMSVCGKNLIPFPYGESTVTKNGVTFTVNDDGSIHLSGTATKVSVFTVFQGSLPLNGIFTLSGVTNKSNPSTHYMQPYIDDVYKESQISGGRTYEINGNLTRIALYVKSGETIDCVVYPQLEIGEKATAYEVPTTQGTNITRALPGIPVTSGGNYTDENGQQWICDEVDLERGVLVKRCDHCVFDGSDDEVWDYEVTKELFKLSYLNLNKEWNVVTNTGRSLMLHYGYDASIWNETVAEYGYCINFDSLFIRHKNITSLDSFKEHIAANPIELTCVMSEPIETPLTAEEITAFKALHTNYPNTTILNDAGAWMSVKYNADTKTYVENPKVLKLTDSSTGVVYELKIVDGTLTVVPV